MITDRLERKRQLAQQESARRQMESIDRQLGVGPWGQSLAPLMQPERDNLTLMMNDPQAFNRKALEAAQRFNNEQARPNPFLGGGGVMFGPGAFNNGRTTPFTSISTPGRPAGSMSFTQTPSGVSDGRTNRPSKFPNPFS